MNENASNYDRRSWHHDYFAPFIYHIILKKTNTSPPFGNIRGDVNIPLKNKGSVYVFLTRLGKSIVKGLKDFGSLYPEINLYQYIIMPDHIHLILSKKVRTNFHLDFYIDSLKKLIIQALEGTFREKLQLEDVFETGYTDKALYDKVDLNNWFQYLKENPYRRAMIIRYPDFFQRCEEIEVNGETFEAYGNIFLLNNPDKMAVRVRRNFSEEQRKNHLEQAIYSSKRGTVLVSPFISPFEKEIRKETEEKGSRFILIQHEKFGERYKPHRHEFNLCSDGRLLIISLGLPKGTPISYAISTKMNELDAIISMQGFRAHLRQKTS